MLSKYEESQGLTEEMIAAELAAVGGPEEKYLLTLFRKGSTERDNVVDMLARAAGITPQAALRKLNPRLRPWPSAEARAAHRGHWLAVCTQDGTACMGRFWPADRWFHHSGNHVMEEGDNFARYWPCDAHGQRVPWPEKDGVML